MTSREWMARAIALGALGEGRTPPNPMVGCVVVRNGEVVGAGYHRAAGEPHAEAQALSAAGTSAHGATLYVNLEPCAHHGRTPPCVSAIVASGVRSVVAATRDPNPLVDGRGFAALTAAGVTVEVGVLESEARALNAPFFSVHERGRPWVTLKAAQSLDGRIAASHGSSTWITNPWARKFAHRMRLAHDAVCVGAGTVRADDPRLTVRLPGAAAPRLRAVLSSGGALDPGARIFQAAPGGPRTRVFVGTGATPAPALAAVADVIPVRRAGAGLDLACVLADLRDVGVQSLLVEGGGRTIASFLAAGLADEIALFVAPSLIGATGATPLVDIPAAASPGEAWRLEVRRSIPIGSDLLLVGRPVAAPCSPA